MFRFFNKGYYDVITELTQAIMTSIHYWRFDTLTYCNIERWMKKVIVLVQMLWFYYVIFSAYRNLLWDWFNSIPILTSINILKVKLCSSTDVLHVLCMKKKLFQDYLCSGPTVYSLQIKGCNLFSCRTCD